MDTAGLVRDTAGTAIAPGFPASERGGSAHSAPRETFAALDSGFAPGTPTWTHAGARQAEAGFQDPALGWVGVKAQVSGGAVHVSVVPGSAEASQELGRHMDALHAYLEEQHTPVGSLAMASPGGRGADQSGGEGLGRQMSQNMQQGQGENAQQQASAAAEAGPASGGAGIGSSAAAESAVQVAGRDGSAYLGGDREIHISVVA